MRPTESVNTLPEPRLLAVYIIRGAIDTMTSACAAPGPKLTAVKCSSREDVNDQTMDATPPLFVLRATSPLR